MKKYLLIAVFNAPNTMEKYYRANVNRDIYVGWYNLSKKEIN